MAGPGPDRCWGQDGLGLLDPRRNKARRLCPPQQMMLFAGPVGPLKSRSRNLPQSPTRQSSGKGLAEAAQGTWATCRQL